MISKKCDSLPISNTINDIKSHLDISYTFQNKQSTSSQHLPQSGPAAEAAVELNKHKATVAAGSGLKLFDPSVGTSGMGKFSWSFSEENIRVLTVLSIGLREALQMLVGATKASDAVTIARNKNEIFIFFEFLLIYVSIIIVCGVFCVQYQVSSRFFVC